MQNNEIGIDAGELQDNEPESFHEQSSNEPSFLLEQTPNELESLHEQTPIEPGLNEPSINEPGFFNEQMINEPMRSAPVYETPVTTETTYNGRTHSLPQGMYSPGICTTHPYTPPREFNAMPVRPPRPRSRKLGGFVRAACLVLICSLFSAAAAYFIMEYRFNRGDFTINRQVVLGAVNTSRPEDNVAAPVAILPGDMTASDIYDMAITQVVGINTEAPGFFDSPGSQGTVSPISGSGFIISGDGYILTNYHVISFAHESSLPISVVLFDGATLKAEVIGFDSERDVAIIKIDATGLSPALIGDSDDIRVGQRIYAVGNPFGDFVYTMTDGIISALDRVVSVERKTINAFQFSAAVNSGNSGGPIYNANGEVIGIVTAKVIRGNVEGIGFAIPINDAIVIATDLIELGYLPGRPLIGVTVQPVSQSHADTFDWVVGVYIRGVNPDSAAYNAGIAIGDIITAIGDEEVDSLEGLRFALRNYMAGDTTTLTVWRNGEFVELTITFDEDLYAGMPSRVPPPEPNSPDPLENIP